MARQGRPKAATEAKRDSRLAVRLTAGERAEIDARAAALACHVSDYARAVLVEGAAPKPARRSSSRPMLTPDELAALNRAGIDLRAIGNNLNQIARALHGNTPRPILDDLAEDLAALRRTREALDALIERGLA